VAGWLAGWLDGETREMGKIRDGAGNVILDLSGGLK